MRLRHKYQAGFLLLEVILSLIILSLVIAGFLRSFTLSVRAIRNNEIVSTASSLSQQLITELELNPVEDGYYEGDFGENHPFYSYSAELTSEELDYQDVALEETYEEFHRLIHLTLTIFYDDGRRQRFSPLKLNTCLSGLERFSFEAKTENQLF